MNEIKSRSEANGNKIKYVDCTKVEHEVETQEITSQKNVIEGLKSSFPGLRFYRLPVCNSGSPNDLDYDLLTGALQGKSLLQNRYLIRIQVPKWILEISMKTEKIPVGFL